MVLLWTGDFLMDAECSGLGAGETFVFLVFANIMFPGPHGPRLW